MGPHGFATALAACPAIAQVYAKYCGIIAGCTNVRTREALFELSQTIDSMGGLRDSLFGDIPKLMPFLDLDDSRQFSTFYEFVFFVSRRNGQKNITKQRAMEAWRIVLKGRFRLLDRWCSFVEMHQQHNLPEDTWQQLLAFSRCVNEDLDGYDPKGAWPVLIDEFVEHMLSLDSSKLPGSKRKCPDQFNSNDEDVELSDNFTRSVHLMPMKRPKESPVNNKFEVWESDTGTPFFNGSSDYLEDMNKHKSRGCLQNLPCIVEGSLSKGFEGYISMNCS